LIHVEEGIEKTKNDPPGRFREAIRSYLVTFLAAGFLTAAFLATTGYFFRV